MSHPMDLAAAGSRAGKSARWGLADIAFDRIDRAAVAGDALAFRVVFVASLIETGSDLYARNLVEYFDGDAELSAWLRESWQAEEVQHGHALRAYVEHAWPGVDWDGTFERFFSAYSQTCTVGALEPTRALELAARCMVETGTATLYGALQRYAREPVLRDLAARIYADEVRHYKYFYRHFRRYQARERQPRWRVGRTLLRRLVETRTGDGYYAYRGMSEPARRGDTRGFEAEYRAFIASFASFIRANAPAERSIRMGLKPLRLPPQVETWITRHSAPVYAAWTGHRT